MADLSPEQIARAKATAHHRAFFEVRTQDLLKDVATCAFAWSISRGDFLSWAAKMYDRSQLEQEGRASEIYEDLCDQEREKLSDGD